MLEFALVPGSSAYKHLVHLAKNGSTTEYRDLANTLKIDLADSKERAYLSGTLETITRFEVENGRPMLSAIVLAHNKDLPNEGFFVLARELGLLGNNDEEQFHQEMLAAVFTHWQNW